MDVPSIPGSFVVNIGDLMVFWTSGRWASTVHRVVNPLEPAASSRISIPFFYLPNHDTSIEPMGVPGTAVRDGVTVGKWFSDKVKAAYNAA